jgi:exonuclease SbcC
MDKKLKQVLTAISAVLMITSLATVLAYAGKGSQSPDVVDTLFNILVDTKNEVDALFDDFTQGGGTIPEDAVESYEKALILWEEAETNYTEEDYEEAADKATEAINEFGEAAEEVSEIEDEELEDEEDLETEKAVGLSVKHQKMMERLEKLRAVVSNLEVNGLEVSDIFSILDQVEAKLNEAKASHDGGDFEGSEESLEVAKALLGKATGFIHSTSNMIKKEKTEKFIEKTMMRVMNLERNVNKILMAKGVSQETIDEISGQFSALVDQLDNLDQVLSEEDLEETVDELDDLVEDIDDVVDEEDELDDDVADALKEMGKLAFKISKYKEEIQELADAGKDVTGLNDVMEDVENLLDTAYIDLGNDDPDVAENKIEEAEDLLDELEDLMEEIEEEHKDEENNDDEKGAKNGKPDDDDVGDGDIETSEDEIHTGEEEDFLAEKAELEEEMESFKDFINSLAEDEIDTAELEEKVEDIEDALELAEDLEDLELIENMMEELENSFKEQYGDAWKEN